VGIERVSVNIRIQDEYLIPLACTLLLPHPSRYFNEDCGRNNHDEEIIHRVLGQKEHGAMVLDMVMDKVIAMAGVEVVAVDVAMEGSHRYCEGGHGEQDSGQGEQVNDVT
jgi:hypothetical protein